MAVAGRRADGAAVGDRRSTSPTSATTATTASARSRAARPVNLNAVDFGAAYLPQNQDPTLGTEHACPARNALSDKPAAAVPRPRQHQPEHDGVLGHVPLDPDVAEPPVPERLLRSASNYTYGPVVQGQHRPAASGSQHAADGTISVRADQAAYEKLNENARPSQRTRHQGERGVGLPNVPASIGTRRRGYILNDWQLSGVLTAGSGARPTTSSYSYQNNGGEREPDRFARLRRADRLRRRPGQRLLGQPVRAVQRELR